MRKSIKKLFNLRKDRKDARPRSSATDISDGSLAFAPHPPIESTSARKSIEEEEHDRDSKDFFTAANQFQEEEALIVSTTASRTGASTSSSLTLGKEQDCEALSDGEEEVMPENASSDSSEDALLGSTIAPKPRLHNILTFQSPAAAAAAGYHDEGESPHLIQSYSEIPVLEQTKLPRGGVSIDTKAVGRVQFGIPPETIKDSMKLGLPVPQVYIVPVERFCREIGPALGVNLAEFEFPAYFNFFVYKKRCTLVVDSVAAEDNIRRVFSETLLGPAQFRRTSNPMAYEPEDFAPDFPTDAIPNFQKELQYFRIMPDGKEIVIDTLLEFRHFEMCSDGFYSLGVPPSVDGEPLGESSDKADARAVEELYGGCDAELGEDDDGDVPEESVPQDEKGVERRETKNPWTYSQAIFMGDVSTVWPTNATEEQIKNRTVPRVEIFKMPGGTEYIVHDVDASNFIVGKARLSGHVKVSESMSVDGFGGHSILDDVIPSKKAKSKNCSELAEDSEASRHIDDIFPPVPPPTFHTPSFGLTVLGNSHGFDKSGSVSGYVLWINGRGVMIDPPPYSSATLEREGIRPRTIVGIILTHCHADHDAGAFQKVLTGSPVVVITTPTIYKSFIRKYAALSALSPALLRHSHRFKPAIIGQPLRFQGATFHFTYTLHTIPCVGFRVEWRGRSMVFTGDHFNSPVDMDKLEASGVLSKARAADLRNLPLQETDLLLHESGAPPIHTPLAVLLQLPPEVKKRLYVVHTSALPPDCELKAAPTGTKGTIRLDQFYHSAQNHSMRSLNALSERNHTSSLSFGDDDYANNWSARSEYETVSVEGGKHAIPGSPRTNMQTNIYNSFGHHDPFGGSRKGRNSVFAAAPGAGHEAPPLVALRPASSTDAWFILNLLSAVPFLSSLSYTSTMELLETARVDAYRKNDVILPAARRSQLLCVVWEGTCSESLCSSTNSTSHASNVLPTVDERPTARRPPAVWHAGDWTGPISFQPDKVLSGESSTSKTHDVVAVSSEGVKVITVECTSLHSILKSGSPLYRKYLERQVHQERAKLDIPSGEEPSTITEKLLDDALKDLNVLELLNCNSALRKLNAVQKRHLESLAEGPIGFQPGERLWRAASPVDRAFIIVSGSASFLGPKRRNAGSATVSSINSSEDDKLAEGSAGAKMLTDAKKALKEIGRFTLGLECDASLSSKETDDQRVFVKKGSSDPNNPDFDKLRQGLERRANHANTEGWAASADCSLEESHGDHESYDTDESQFDYTFIDDMDAGTRSHRNSVLRRRSSRARQTNKVLGRLYNRRAFTGGLVFSRGHFLGDVSKMVAGLLASDLVADANDDGPVYGFGDHLEGVEDASVELVIPEEGPQQITHNSTLTAGKDGCVALVFPKSSIIPFLDQYPGLLLSLLGTQVVV